MSDRHIDPARLLRWLTDRLSVEVAVDMGVSVALSKPPSAVYGIKVARPARPTFCVTSREPCFASTSKEVTDDDFAFACGLVSVLDRLGKGAG